MGLNSMLALSLTTWRTGISAMLLRIIFDLINNLNELRTDTGSCSHNDLLYFIMPANLLRTSKIFLIEVSLKFSKNVLVVQRVQDLMETRLMLVPRLNALT